MNHVHVAVVKNINNVVVNKSRLKSTFLYGKNSILCYNIK